MQQSCTEIALLFTRLADYESAKDVLQQIPYLEYQEINAFIISLLERFPIIVWGGAALLGWIAGEIIAKDPLITGHLDPGAAHTVSLVGAGLGALFVVGVGLIRRHWRSAPDEA